VPIIFDWWLISLSNASNKAGKANSFGKETGDYGRSNLCKFNWSIAEIS